MLACTDDHLTRLSPVILNLERKGLTHLECELRVASSLGQLKILLSYLLTEFMLSDHILYSCNFSD